MSAKTYSARPDYKFLPTNLSLPPDPMMFELDEADIWNSVTSARATSPAITKSARNSATTTNTNSTYPKSLPVNVPDWSKILKGEYRENCKSEEDDFYEDDDAGSEWVPPHEFLARNRVVSFSVHEGIGRTLKGRDLSRVRNAIWQKTGFED